MSPEMARQVRLHGSKELAPAALEQVEIDRGGVAAPLGSAAGAVTPVPRIFRGLVF
jgi:outer membrane receptor protein involved in Fe transport